MNRHFTGRLIAVDASEHRPLVVDPYWELACPSGLDILRRNLNPFRRSASMRSIFDVLRRTATLASERQSQEARQTADVLIVPPVAAFSNTDSDDFDTIVERGYRHAVEQLEARDRSAPA
jgi:predicted acylesterase/phospholipase RssA